MALAPPQAAPITALMDASSSSIWMNAPPDLGIRSAMTSATSVAGVMGYPAKKEQPANKAPSTQAWLPWMTMALDFDFSLTSSSLGVDVPWKRYFTL